MAAIAPTYTFHGEHTVVATWAAVTSADTATPVGPRYADFSDRSCQITGTFNAATVVWQGSNDGTQYESLTDPQGNAISKNTLGTTLEAITEATLFARPSFSGGGGSQSLNCILVMRRGRGGMEV